MRLGQSRLVWMTAFEAFPRRELPHLQEKVELFPFSAVRATGLDPNMQITSCLEGGVFLPYPYVSGGVMP